MKNLVPVQFGRCTETQELIITFQLNATLVQADALGQKVTLQLHRHIQQKSNNDFYSPSLMISDKWFYFFTKEGLAVNLLQRFHAHISV